MRITNNTVSDQVIHQIQSLGGRQAKLQNQVSTGQKIFEAEDNPAAIGRVINLESEQRQIGQYGRNVTHALSLSQASFAGLQSVKKVSDRATEIGVLGAGVNGAAASAAYATEVDQLIEQSFQAANARLGNDYLFAGTAVDTAPFTVTRNAAGKITAVAYVGNTDRMAIPVSESSSLTPGVSGATNTGLGDFINHLVALRDALQANDPAAVGTVQTGLITDEDNLVSSIAEQGGIQTRIEAAQSQQVARSSTLESLISDETDADLPSTLVKLSQATTAYQAALQSGASIMKLSLLDYIR
ncbi:MAG: flagellar hook-associated protein FlgL [Undibacterium sp.]|nr:flagellar hook-associated protein FlgL [Opitutaceae bacterium]